MMPSNFIARISVCSIIAVLSIAVIAPCSHAWESLQDRFIAANTAFDSAAASIAHDPQAAKSALSSAATLYEHIAHEADLADNTRARVLYNAGVAHQLAEQPGPAILAYRRAELLNPNTTGLATNLAEARRSVSGTSPASAAAPAIPPHSTGTDGPPAAAKTAEQDTLPARPPLELATNFIRSIPRQWLWNTALAAFIGFWVLALLRLLLPRTSWRPHAGLIALVATTAVFPAAALWHRQTLLQNHHDAVLMLDTTPRTGPDDLTFAPSSASPAKAGTEIVTLETRDGGDGRTWVRARTRDAASADLSFWLPRNAVELVMPMPGAR